METSAPNMGQSRAAPESGIDHASTDRGPRQAKANPGFDVVNTSRLAPYRADHPRRHCQTPRHRFAPLVLGEHSRRGRPQNRGGLAGWQKRAVVGYIEQHLGEQVSLSRLANLAQRSQHHFVGRSSSRSELHRIDARCSGAWKRPSYCWGIGPTPSRISRSAWVMPRSVRSAVPSEKRPAGLPRYTGANSNKPAHARGTGCNQSCPARERSQLNGSADAPRQGGRRPFIPEMAAAWPQVRQRGDDNDEPALARSGKVRSPQGGPGLPSHSGVNADHLPVVWVSEMV
jgi:hypothetical protein